MVKERNSSALYYFPGAGTRSDLSPIAAQRGVLFGEHTLPSDHDGTDVQKVCFSQAFTSF